MARRTISLALREEWMESFGAWLKRKRQLTRTTQTQLAEHLGVRQGVISHFECAREAPTREMAADIGEFFDEPQTAMAAAGFIPFQGWRPRPGPDTM